MEILALKALLQISSVGSLPATRARIERTWGSVSSDAPRISWLSLGFSSMPHNWFVTALLSASSAVNGSFAKKCFYLITKKTQRCRGGWTQGTKGGAGNKDISILPRKSAPPAKITKSSNDLPAAISLCNLSARLRGKSTPCPEKICNYL